MAQNAMLRPSPSQPKGRQTAAFFHTPASPASKIENGLRKQTVLTLMYMTYETEKSVPAQECETLLAPLARISLLIARPL